MPTKNPYGNTYIADLPEPETISAEEILESIDNKSIDLVCVLGPTASGKTKYAVELARELNRLRAEGWAVVWLRSNALEAHKNGIILNVGEIYGSHLKGNLAIDVHFDDMFDRLGI